MVLLETPNFLPPPHVYSILLPIELSHTLFEATHLPGLLYFLIISCFFFSFPQPKGNGYLFFLRGIFPSLVVLCFPHTVVGLPIMWGSNPPRFFIFRTCFSPHHVVS